VPRDVVDLLICLRLDPTEYFVGGCKDVLEKQSMESETLSVEARCSETFVGRLWINSTWRFGRLRSELLPTKLSSKLLMSVLFLCKGAAVGGVV